MGFETFTVINCYDFLDSNNRLICKHCKILKVKVYESGSDKNKRLGQQAGHRTQILQCLLLND